MRKGVFRRLLAGLLFGVLTFGATTAFADGRAELEKARASYLARNWPEAEERARALADPATGLKDRALVSQARMILGAALIAQGKKDAAVEVFEKLVLEDSTFEPDPLSYPSDVINTFIDTRAQLAERIKNQAVTLAKLEAERKAREEAEREKQRRWLELVKAQAQEERITVKNSRLVACLPFGVGQFQNEQSILGWIFLGTEAALVVGTAITLPMHFYARGRREHYVDTQDLDLAVQWDQRADQIQVANLILAGSFLAVAGVGILQANLNFQPTRDERKRRELPPLGKWSPVLTPLAGGGAYVGVTGATF
jgi:hypothetical protein